MKHPLASMIRICRGPKPMTDGAIFRRCVRGAWAFGLVCALSLAWAADLSAQEEEEGAATGAQGLEYRLDDDPYYDVPLLNRSHIINDGAVRSIETRVEEYRLQEERDKERQRIFLEDIEKLDDNPFLK